jgi:O-antigen ligase
VDSGVFGLATFIGISVAGVYAAVRVRRLSATPLHSTTPGSDRDLALALFASLAVVFPTYATFDFAAFPHVSATAFLLAGISGALLRVVRAEATAQPTDPYAIV